MKVFIFIWIFFSVCKFIKMIKILNFICGIHSNMAKYFQGQLPLVLQLHMDDRHFGD
jgi:hypothetical protein